MIRRMFSQSEASMRSQTVAIYFLNGQHTWGYPDQSIVGYAATESASARIQDTPWLRTSWDGLVLDAGVKLEGSRFVGELGVSLCPLLVLVVVDEDVPSQLGILCDLGLVAWNGNVHVADLIISSFDQESLLASHSQAAGQRATTSTTADDNVLIVGWCGGSSSKPKKGQEREEKPHCDCA